MRKRLACLVVAICSSIIITGCAFGPSMGLVYSNVKTPMVRLQAPLDAKSATKVGTGQYFSVLGIVAIGDASVETIMRDSGIKKIHHVDQENSNILFFFSKCVVSVYGE